MMEQSEEYKNLMGLVKDGQVHKVRNLLEMGIDLDALCEDMKDEDDNPLLYATIKGDLEIVSLLLTCTKDNETIQKAFDLAAKKGHVEVAEELLGAGADVMLDGWGQEVEGGRCPICYVAETNCKHSFAITQLPDEKSFYFSDDLDNLIDELLALIEEAESMKFPAPKDIRKLLLSAAKDRDFWTEGLVGQGWETYLNPMALEGATYYHEDAEKFTNDLRGRVLEALEWLKDYNLKKL